MDSISMAAASGLRTRMDALDLLSNNLANASTSGFKADREFYGLFSGEGTGGTTLPSIDRSWVDFSQGQLQPTGNPLDVSLSGKGFFVLNGKSGPVYTRSGNFQISSTGVLTGPDGIPVRASGGGAIQIEKGQNIEISADGTVQQGGQTLGKLEIVDFADTSVLAKLGGSIFRNQNPKETPTEALDVTVRQGYLESSNVSAAESAVRLVGLMRQFEMLQRAVTMSADMNRKSIDEVAKVGG